MRAARQLGQLHGQGTAILQRVPHGVRWKLRKAAALPQAGLQVEVMHRCKQV